MASLRTALFAFFFVSIPTSYGVIYKVGEVVSVTCPLLEATDPNAPALQWSPYLNRFKTEDGSGSILLQGVNPYSNTSGVCDVGTPDQKKACEPFKTRINPQRVTITENGKDFDAVKYSYTIADDDGGFSIECRKDEDGNFIFPKDYNGGNKRADITVVDPDKIAIEVDPLATGDGLAEGEKLNATCKVPGTGKNLVNVRLVMKIGDEKLANVMISTVGNEVLAKTSDTLMKKDFHQKQIECHIEDDGAVWGNVTRSAPLIALFAPFDVTPNETLIEVRKVENSPVERMVSCSAKAGNPPVFNWTVVVKDKESKDERPDNVVKEVGKDQDTYAVTVKVIEENLEVHCIAANDIGSDKAVVNIEIVRAPRISGIAVFVNGTEKVNGQIDLGADRKETVTLKCRATPIMAKVTWYKMEGGKETAVTEGTSGMDLTLNVTHLNDGDVYRCKATVDGQTKTAVSIPNRNLFLSFPVKAVVDQEVKDGKKLITVTADGNPFHEGLKDYKLDVEAADGSYLKEFEADSVVNDNKMIYRFEMSGDDLNKTYTFKLKKSGNPAVVWTDNAVKVEAIKVTDPTTPVPEPSLGSGAVAGIIIAVILIVLCAILLIVMWKKGLLCAQEDKPKAYGAPSTAGSTAGALDHAEQGYGPEDVEYANGGVDGVVNPAGPNAMNGYPPPPPDDVEAPGSYYTPVIRNPEPAIQNPDQIVDDQPDYSVATDVENNLAPPLKEADGLSVDSGVERNGHLPPETGV